MGAIDRTKKGRIHLLAFVLAFGIAFAAIFAVATPARALDSVLYVNSSGTTEGATGSKENPFPSLRAAILEINKVTSGTFTVNIESNLTETGNAVLQTNKNTVTLNIPTGTTITYETGKQMAVYDGASLILDGGGSIVLPDKNIMVGVIGNAARAGNLTIKNANVTCSNGDIAILAYQGTLTIEGGTITGGGLKDSSDIGSSAIQLGYKSQGVADYKNVVQSCQFTMTGGTIQSSNLETRTSGSLLSIMLCGEGSKISGGTIQAAPGVTAITNYYGNLEITGGKITGGGTNSSGESTTAIAVGATKSSTNFPPDSEYVGKITIGGGAQKATVEGGVFVQGNGNLTVEDNADITDSTGFAIATNGSDPESATIIINGGTLTGGDKACALYLPSCGTEGSTADSVTITGGEITGGAGIVNIGSKLEISGDPVITATSSDNVKVGDSAVSKTGSGFPPAAVTNVTNLGDYGALESNSVQLKGGTYKAAGTQQSVVFGVATQGGEENKNGDTFESQPSSSNGSVVVTAGSYSPALSANELTNFVSSDDPAISTGSGESSTSYVGQDTINDVPASDLANGVTVQKAPESGTVEIPQLPSGTKVENESGSSVTVETNNGNLSIEDNGSATVPNPSAPPTPTPTPGAESTIKGEVAKAEPSIVNNMKPYATVTSSNDNLVWTIEANEEAGDTSLETVANGLIVPLVNAFKAGGSPSATNVQSSSVTLALPSATTARIQAFALSVLQNAVAVRGGVPAANASTQALSANATLADLSGMTCGITAATSTGTLTYTINFVGESTPASQVKVYRLYNPYTFTHLYSVSWSEVATLDEGGWDYEGVAWNAPASKTATSVWRLYNRWSDDHLYTTSDDEIKELTDAGWTVDGTIPLCYGAEAETYPVYRLYNPYATENAGRGSHLWTASEQEYEDRFNDGWEKEGIVFYAQSLPQ